MRNHTSNLFKKTRKLVVEEETKLYFLLMSFNVFLNFQLRWHSLLQMSQLKLFGLSWDSECISRSTLNSNVWYHSLHECRSIRCLRAHLMATWAGQAHWKFVNVKWSLLAVLSTRMCYIVGYTKYIVSLAPDVHCMFTSGILHMYIICWQLEYSRCQHIIYIWSNPDVNI